MYTRHPVYLVVNKTDSVSSDNQVSHTRVPPARKYVLLKVLDGHGCVQRDRGSLLQAREDGGLERLCDWRGRKPGIETSIYLTV